MSDLKNVKKGNTVIMCGFTGMKLGVYKVTAADKATITIEKADGTEVEFSRKTGKQQNPNNPKYANFIIEDDGSYVNPRDAKKAAAKKSTKKANTKKAKKEEVVEDEEELEEEVEDEEEEETPKKSTKKAKKAKKVVEDDEDDDDEYEEV